MIEQLDLGPDARGDTLLRAIPESKVIHAAGFRVEYGIRFDDGAGVAHFYAPLPFNIWDAAFPDILREVVEKTLDTSKVTLGFTAELYSFYLTVNLGEEIDDRWFDQTLQALNARLESGTSSGTTP